MFARKISSMTQRHLRQYNPFVEFKSDVRIILDKHIQMTNMITITGFGAMGGGLVMLYQKTESDKKELKEDVKELNAKMDNNTKELNAKMDLILTQISTPKKTWF